MQASFPSGSHPVIRGAFFLTAAGMLTRVMGFFYRIFLSRLIGAEGLGIYQLLSPVMTLGFAVTAAGIQTAISRFVSSELAQNNPAGARLYFRIGLLLSLFDRIPKEGDVAVLEDRGTKVTFTVLAMDRLRIDRILVVIDKPAAEEE